MGSFRYDTDRLTDEQVRLAYKTDVEQVQQRLFYIVFVIENGEANGLPESKLNKLKEERKELTILLHNLETEQELVQL